MATPTKKSTRKKSPAKTPTASVRLPASIGRAWHAEPFERLQQRFDSAQAPHALLITGPVGIGKRAFAEALIGACLGAGERTPEDLAANPDFRQVGLVDEARQIVVDQIRELQAFVSLTATSGGYRFVLIEPADSMNVNAQNALLKTLEEPPAGAVICLVTSVAGRLLPTVRSRCQRILLTQPSQGAAEAWLREKDASPKDVALALRLARGAPRIAAGYLSPEWLADAARLERALIALMRAEQGPLSLAIEYEKKLAELPIWDMTYDLVKAALLRASSVEQALTADVEHGPPTPAGALTEKRRQARAFEALDRIVEARELGRQGRALRPRNMLEHVFEAMSGLTAQR